MPAPDDWRRPGPTPRQRRADLAVGAGVAVLATVNLMLSRATGRFPDTAAGTAEQVCWVLAVSLPLIWRRSHPATALVLIAASFIGAQARGVPEQQVAAGVIFAAVYALGAWGRDRSRSRWLRIVVIAAMFAWLFTAWAIWHQPTPGGGLLSPLVAGIVNGVLINTLVFGFAYLFGETAWLAARRQHQLEEQAAELRAAQALAGERAVFGERVRIARELHDVVAHHVSVMGIQASAARRAIDRDLGKARTALTAVEENARTAVDELRRLLGALRDVPAPQPPTDVRDLPAPAGIGHVGELVERIRQAGLAADYAVYGDPVPLPDSVSQSAYRIVQEALTNTLKHARATTVDVRIRYLARELEIDVTDDGRGGTGPAPHGGLGLIGMHERATIHDGTVETGPRAAGGFRVRARLPLTPALVRGPA